MSELLGIMLNVISPIFIIVGVVMVVARRLHPDPRGLSTVLVYLFVPALAFTGITQSNLQGNEVAGIAGVALGIAFAMSVVGLGLSRMLGFDRRLESAFLISIIMMNAANYGIPLNEFAFGPEGKQRAIIYYSMSVMIGSILGVFFASRGQATIKEAVLNVLKIPITYAVIAGLIVTVAGIPVPLPLERSINVLAQGSVPTMLALLGIKLSEVSLKVRWKPLLLAVGIRLVLAPLIAFPLAMLLGLTGVTFQVAVVESSMPTAVLANALATQFNSDTDFTASVTLVGTLASVISLSILLAILMP